MDIKAKHSISSKPSNTVKPRKETTNNARTEKKEQKKVRAEKAIQKKEGRFAENYRRATAKSDIEYAVDSYLRTETVSTSKPSSLPNTLATDRPNKTNE